MRPLVLCAGFALSAALLGCGGSGDNPYSTSAFAVSGRLLSPSGEPVHGGAEVVLTPKAKGNGIFGKESSATVGPDGSFKLKAADGTDGVPGGYYLVVARPYGPQNDAAKQAASRAIPRKFWSEDTSDLTVELTEAKSGWDLKLTK